MERPKQLEGIISYLTKKHGGNVHEKGIVTVRSKSVLKDDPKYFICRFESPGSSVWHSICRRLALHVTPATDDSLTFPVRGIGLRVLLVFYTIFVKSAKEILILRGKFKFRRMMHIRAGV
jgi:hypothetical protein